MSRSSN